MQPRITDRSSQPRRLSVPADPQKAEEYPKTLDSRTVSRGYMVMTGSPGRFRRGLQQADDQRKCRSAFVSGGVGDRQEPTLTHNANGSC
jgi:hypothetical protein